ncbi:DNRLRE domain-containing protein [Demequina sediminis]|nr:DNRLRE domain-containing protein [Demequina sediminis]
MAVTEAGPAAAAVIEESATDWTVAGASGGLTAPDAVSASVLARVRGEAVEDVSQRTESSQTFALPDGQWRSDMSSGPEWVATGEDPSTEAGWERVDTQLVRYSDGSYRPVAHPGDLVFSGGGNGRVDVVAGVDAEGQPFTLSWEGTVPAPVVEADAIRYVDVLPGIDLVFYVTATGYEQFFVAHDADALERAERLTLTVASPDGDLRKAREEVVVRGSEGDVVAQVSDVAVWDAHSDERRMVPVASMAADDATQASSEPVVAASVTAVADLNVPPTEIEVPAAVAVTDGVATISVDADDVPFSDGDAFPVVIDPSVNLSLTFDTYVSNASTVDKSSETELRVGTWDSGASKYRSYLNVNVSPILGKKVTSATLKLYNWHSWSCTARNWEVWSTSTTSTATRWSNMPAMSVKYDTVSSTKGYSSSCSDGWVSADVTTMAQNWSTGTVTAKGIGVKASSETDNSYWKRFYSGNSASNKPVLSVTYNSYPNTPMGVKVNASAPVAGSTVYTNDPTPTFSVTVSDPDGGNVKGKFSFNGATAVSGSTVASGAVSSYTLPTQANGSSRTVKVWANDGSLDSKASSNPTWSVVVDTVAPGATTISSAQVSHGQWLETPPASISASLAATDAVKFEYKVDGGTVKTVNATSGSAIVTGLPRTNGGHKVEARAIDRAGNTSAWKTLEYGIGTVGITSPTAAYKTTDKVKISADAPPGANGTVKRAVYWRAGGTANGAGYSDATGSTDGWEKIADLPDATAGSSAKADYTWNAAATAASAGKERVPFLMEVQVCFTYTYTNDVLCTWRDDPATHPSVLRIPHAFGNNFPVADAGPGQVSLWTGEFHAGATDAAVPGYMDTLSVSRNYLTFGDGGASSVFGPGWIASFDGPSVGAAGMRVIDNTGVDGTIAFEDGTGSYFTFREPSAGIVAREIGAYAPLDRATIASGAQLTLTGSGTAARLVLTDGNVSTTWSYMASGEWKPLYVDKQVSATAVLRTTYTYDALGRVESIVAPAPEGVDCSTVSSAGCRALEMTYYTAMDAATGAYTGRIASIGYRAWDPDLEAMRTDAVVAYTYDSSGRLARAIDPRSGLGTTYGYTMSGGVLLLTLVAESGLAPWTIEYGTSTQGASSVLRVTRKHWDGTQADVPVARFVYGIDTANPPAASPDIRSAATAWTSEQTATTGFAVFGQGHDPGGSTVASVDSNEWLNASVTFTDAHGRVVNTANYGAGAWQYTASDYDDNDNVEGSLDVSGTTTVASQVTETAPTVDYDNVQSASTRTEYNDSGTRITDIWTPQAYGATTHIHYTYADENPVEAERPLAGAVPNLVWKTDITSERGNSSSVISTYTMTYAGTAWFTGVPSTVTTTGADTAESLSAVTGFDALGRPVLSQEAGSTGADAGTTHTVYYTAGANDLDTACGNQPAWAGEICVTKSLADLPLTRMTRYSMYLDPETIVEGVGNATRTTTTSYLLDGRLESTSVATMGFPGSTPLPSTWHTYDSTTGLQTKTTSGSTAGPGVRTTYDTWGRVQNYVDTDGATTVTTYDMFGNVGSIDDGLQVTTYTYDGTDANGLVERRGLVTGKVVTSSDGQSSYAFAAAYDAMGRLTRQTMPGEIVQLTTYSDAGHVAELSYAFVTDDGETPLLTWSADYDAAGRMTAESTPATGLDPDHVTGFGRTYAYDAFGRLVTVQDQSLLYADPADTSGITPCVTRSYTFDTRGHRLARNTAISDTANVCPAVGTGTSETWTYDNKDRVQTGANGTGSYVYDLFGRQTTIPAVDTAGGVAAGDITLGYYDNDLAHAVSQAGVTTTYSLDAAQRRSIATTVSGAGTSTLVRHYADGSDNPAWAVETDVSGATTTTWYGSAIEGGLGLTVSSEVASLQLADLRGDIALPLTIAADGAVTGVGAYSDYDEYGRLLAGNVAAATGAITYGWLGSHERAADSFGLTLMGVRLYNAQTGLFTSVDPVVGGNETVYGYPADPINKLDTTGALSAWAKAGLWAAALVIAGGAQVFCTASIALRPVCTGFFTGVSSILKALADNNGTLTTKQIVSAFMKGFVAGAFLGASKVVLVRFMKSSLGKRASDWILRKGRGGRMEPAINKFFQWLWY